MPDRSANGKVPVVRSSKLSIGRRCGHYRWNALISASGRARVNVDYHIAFDTNFYSVPYNLVHELMEVRATPTTVEILHKGSARVLICAPRGHGHTITILEHRPKSHQAHLEWTPSRLVQWQKRSVPTPPVYLNASWRTNRIRKWASADA